MDAAFGILINGLNDHIMYLNAKINSYLSLLKARLAYYNLDYTEATPVEINGIDMSQKITTGTVAAYNEYNVIKMDRLWLTAVSLPDLKLEVPSEIACISREGSSD